MKKATAKSVVFSGLKSSPLFIIILEINNNAIHPPAKADGFLAKGLINDKKVADSFMQYFETMWMIAKS